VLSESKRLAFGGVFALEGAGFEAAVQDADEPVGQPWQGVVVPVSALLVVERAGAGRNAEGGERLSDQVVFVAKVTSGAAPGEERRLPSGQT
jgi:hypothetical protein